MWNKKTKEPKSGEKLFVIYDFESDYFNDVFTTEEDAHKKLLGMTFAKVKKILEVQVIGESKAHICFCKQTHCCCAPK